AGRARPGALKAEAAPGRAHGARLAGEPNERCGEQWQGRANPNAQGLSASGGPSQDGAAWSYLKGGDAPAVEHYKPAAVPAAQYAVLFPEGGDDMVHDLVRRASVLLVGDV